MFKTIKVLAGLALLVVTSQAQAIITLSPPGDASTNDNSNLGDLTSINAAFGTTYTDVDLLWKSDEVKGLLSTSYSWSDDFNILGGTITYTGGATADCPTCFLIVKDGNADPAQYLFDLGSWNGMETIQLTDFWPEKWDVKTDDAGNVISWETPISHVEIWGGEGDVPEPGMLALLAIGLVSFAVVRRKKSL